MISDTNDYANDSTRFCATILIEAKTPFKICSDDYSVMLDSPILTDLNGLPAIPGTSIAGVLRKAVNNHFKNDKDSLNVNNIFGNTGADVENMGGNGSKIMFSHASVVDKDGLPAVNIVGDLNNFLNLISFDNLPVRERNAVTGKGVTRKHSKFDEQIVPKGVRFAFEIEFKGNYFREKDKKAWNSIIYFIKSDNFRLGGGTRHGFGLFRLLNLKENIYKLEDEKELNDYVNRGFLSEIKESFEEYENNVKDEDKIQYIKDDSVIEYKLKLKPRDFFIFSSGYSSESTGADMTPLKEIAITYNKDKEDEIYYVLPVSSIKGAISHRIAYHYNIIKENFIDDVDRSDDDKAETLESPQNYACKILFGSGKEKGDKGENYAGNTFFEDIFVEEGMCKIVSLQHVKIDRFTGKSIDGALFDEEVLQITGDSGITLRFLIKKDAVGQDKDVENALKRTIFDIENGLLPLGGGVNRGHGTFEKN